MIQREELLLSLQLRLDQDVSRNKKEKVKCTKYLCYSTGILCYTIRMYKNFKKGFTVLELLIVVAMIGILIGIVLVSFSKAKTHVSDDGKVSMFNLMALSLELYRAQCHVYPLDLDPTRDNGYPINGAPQSCLIRLNDVLDPTIDTSLFEYAPLRSTLTRDGMCSSYHLAVQLEEVGTTPTLASDSDWTGSGDLTACSMGASSVSYDDAAGFYDKLIPS